MNCRIHNLTDYAYSSGEKILVDTNIWLLLYPPFFGDYDERHRKYSLGFKKIWESKKVRLIVDILILSEYSTVFIRKRAEEYYRENPSPCSRGNVKKKFRTSDEYPKVVAEVKRNIQRILKECRNSNHAIGLKAIERIERIVEECLQLKIDFNDAIILDICREKGFKLLTDDADFKHCGIELLTGNKRLLGL